MPQWRKLWVKTVDSEDVNDMPDDFTRLMWTLMPLALDREGRAKDIVASVRSKLFPIRRDVTIEQVAAALDWYADRGMIVRYKVEGREYFHVPTFAKHQGDTKREAASVLPEPPHLEPLKRPAINSADLDATNDNEESRPTQDLVVTNSRAEERRGDIDLDTDKDIPSGEPEKTAPGPVPTFAEWRDEIQQADTKPGGRTAVLVRMVRVLYPNHDPPEPGFVGKAAIQVGGAARLAQLLWETATRPPAGDPVRYCLERGKRERRDGQAKGKTTDGRSYLTGQYADVIKH